MRFGLEIMHLEAVGRPGAGRVLARVARAAEDAGFDSVWVWDHFIHPFRWERPTLEGWVTLGYLASATERVRLGTMVTGVTHRHPAVLVKQATTLDVLSGGRAYFGVGAAWNEREHAAFGIPFPRSRERFQLLEDTLRIAHRAWRGETAAFRGAQVVLSEQMDAPQPMSQPHPAILVGGGGERRTLRLVAQYADAANFGGDPERFGHKREVLRRHCEEVGRRFEEIELTTGIDVGDPNDANRMADPSLLVERIGVMAERGAHHLIFPLPDMERGDSIERFGRDVISQVPQPSGAR